MFITERIGLTLLVGSIFFCIHGNGECIQNREVDRKKIEQQIEI